MIVDRSILLFLIATLPVFLVLYYFWRRDKGQKEPFRLMMKVFLWGVLVTVPVAFFELVLNEAAVGIFGKGWFSALIMPFLLVAIPEEFAKYWVVKTRVYNHVKFNEVMDGISYAILASMGFAVLENLLYTVSYGAGVGLFRAVTAVPAHALFAGIMGYHLGLAKFEKDERREKDLLMRGLILAIFFHGLYDFLLLSDILVLASLVLPLIGIMGIHLNKLIRKAHPS